MTITVSGLLSTNSETPRPIQSQQFIDGLLGREDLRAQTAVLAELRSLARETDPEMLSEDLFAFATRQEQAGRESLAAEIYQGLQEQGANPAAHRAGARLAALQGQGPVGNRLEIFCRHVVAESTSPSALLAMGAAGTAFRVVRLASLGRLAGSAVSTPLTRGLGAKLLSNFAGFLAEGSTFALSGRALRSAFGHSQDWSTNGLGRDLALGYLTLGGLRLAGVAGSSLYRAAGAPSGWTQALFHQASMLGGIYLAHEMAQRTGLESRDLGFAEALATLVQFNLMGSVVRRGLGQGFANWETRLDQQADLLAEQNSRSRHGRGISLRPPLQPAEALAGPTVIPSAPEEITKGPNIMQMAASKAEGGGERKYSDEGLRAVRQVRTLQIPQNAPPEQVQRILKRWIEAQPYAIAVARMAPILRIVDLAHFVMCNSAFTAKFGWTDEQISTPEDVLEARRLGRETAEPKRGRAVRNFFPPLRVGFIASRVGLMNLSGEFAPSPIPWLKADGSYVDVIGAGIVCNFNGDSLGIGVFTNVEGESITPTPTSGIAVRQPTERPPATSSPTAVTIAPPGFVRRPPMIRRGSGTLDAVQRALSGELPPEDPDKKGDK